jgi:hypothetical protein
MASTVYSTQPETFIDVGSALQTDSEATDKAYYYGSVGDTAADYIDSNITIAMLFKKVKNSLFVTAPVSN